MLAFHGNFSVIGFATGDKEAVFGEMGDVYLFGI